MIKLHLGCGKRNFGEDWVHIDAGNYEHVQLHDVKKLPFYYSEVDVIYASHLLEYFDRDEVVSVLQEWHRALKPEGILRIAVPDFRAMATLYANTKITLREILGPLYGKIMVGDRFAYHKTVYDFPSLCGVLIATGFKNVCTYDRDATEHAQFDDHSAAYLKGVLISLNVECTK